MGSLLEALERHQIVGLDTPIFAYHIEQTPQRATSAGRALRALSGGRFAGVTSVLTLLELTIKPLRIGRPDVADAYDLLVQDIDNLMVVDIDARVSRIGAGLRAKHGLRTPDAVQIAACLAHGATAFLTNDRRLRRVNEISVLLLDDFAEIKHDFHQRHSIGIAPNSRCRSPRPSMDQARCWVNAGHRSLRI